MDVPRGESGWERLFWLVFERTSNPLALLDHERRIVDLNRAATELLGAPREQLIGRSMLDSVKPSERDQSIREWEAFLRSGEYSGRRDLVRADGSEVEVEFAARLASVAGERMAIYVAMAADEAGRRVSARAAQLALTNREREVVTLIALGDETGEIARKLHVSPETVRTHVRNAMTKLDVHTRAQLVAVVLCAEDALHEGPLSGG